jgi:hypothetical protein
MVAWEIKLPHAVLNSSAGGPCRNGHVRALAVTDNSEKPQVAGPLGQQPG